MIRSFEWQSERVFQQRTSASLDWLRRSIDAHQGKGSSAFLFLGKWSPPYPETTGYLIETLLDYADFRKEPLLEEYARHCGAWLLEVQHPPGSFPSLYSDSGKPSIFNTAMILFGLSRLARLDPSGPFLSALTRASAWLLSELAPDGSWPAHSYVKGFVPSYYTRAVWALLSANSVLNDPAISEGIERAIRFYAARIKQNGYVHDWGFHPGKPAFTHTIAYTWRGLWETAILLGDEAILEKVRNGLTTLSKQGKRLPGRVGTDGTPDFSFSCLTGNVQLSALASRIYAHTGENHFQEISRRFFLETAAMQVDRPGSLYHGAFAGSSPLWGPYQRFRYPNWGVKFFLDAYLLLF